MFDRHIQISLLSTSVTSENCSDISDLGYRRNGRYCSSVDPMPDKINLDYLKLVYGDFQKYKVMTMSVVGAQPKRHANPSYKATKHIERSFLISDYY